MFPESGMDSWSMVRSMVINAPTIELPQPTGDAISREAVIDIIKRFGYVTVAEMINAVDELPSISPAKYGVEDVTKGVGWVCGGLRKRIVRAGRGYADVTFLDGSDDGVDCEPTFSTASVAAMLNAADTVTFPVGHPRNPKVEPELDWKNLARKVIERVLLDSSFKTSAATLDACKALTAAIEREGK
jgi:hypothetical protein